MKAFHFRLDQALRWRGTQADLGKARVSEAVTRLSALQKDLEVRRGQMAAGSLDLVSGATGAALGHWTAYVRRSHREIAELEKRLQEAERQFGECMRILVDANRKVRLLENLKLTARTRWDAAVDRELEAFAGEAFLVGYNRESRRARSSGG